jgi:cytochrome d ubiquinol oxidase subunit I
MMDSILFTNLLFARLQMAFTLGAHIILACLGVGLPALMLAAEGAWLRTGDKEWRELARRWSRGFGLLFAVGAVSGTAISFELGLLWPGFIGRFGGVIGPAFTLEGFPFFFEAIFLGLYVYGWDRLGRIRHWLSGLPVALSGLASAFFVVTANAWMNSPSGFELAGTEVVRTDPWAAIFNAATPTQTTHMIVTAYMVTGFCVAAVYAWFRWRGARTSIIRKALYLGLGMGCLMAPLQVVVGDWSAKSVARRQPVKLAAMEGQFQTQKGAPLRVGGLPLQSQKRVAGAVEIPKGLSFLAYGDLNAEVKGLNDFPPDLLPPVAVVHLAFQAMVGAGFFLLGLAVVFALGLWRYPRFLRHPFFLLAVLASGPLSVLALEAGWTVTEVGRQPWIVYNLMRTSQAVTLAPNLGWLLAVSVVFYAVLATGTILGLVHLSRRSIKEGGYGA